VARIFISYSHKDQEFVDLIEFILTKDGSSLEVFRDIRQPVNKLNSILNHPCDFFMPVVTDNYHQSKYCAIELQQAIQQNKEHNTPQIVPVMAERDAAPIHLAETELIHYNLWWPQGWKESFLFHQEVEKLKHRLRMSVIKSGYLDFTHPAWFFSPANELQIARREAGIKLSSRNDDFAMNKAVVLTYYDWVDLGMFSKVEITVKGSAASDFGLWNKDLPKMLKMEIDGMVASPSVENSVDDDASYLKPADGTFILNLDDELYGEQKRKIEFVIGAARLRDFSFTVKFIKA